jgi:hypothetical protein
VKTILFTIVLAACNSKSSRSEYEDAVANLDDPAKRSDAFTIIERTWRTEQPASFEVRKTPIQWEYGSGPLPLKPRDVALRPKLLDLLSDPDPFAQMHAVYVLRAMRPPGHDERLLRCALHDPMYASTCMDILMVVADEQALTALVPSMNVSRGERSKDSTEGGVAIAIDLAHLGKRGVPFLAKAVANGTSHGCENALVGLRTLLDPEYLASRIEPTRLQDPALKPAVLAAVRLGIKQPYWGCRRHAAMLLAAHDPEPRALLTELVNDPSAMVREAVEALLNGRAAPDFDKSKIDMATGNRLSAN